MGDNHEQEIRNHFKPGDIVVSRFDPVNPPHHTTTFGRVIRYCQSYMHDVDPANTHLSMLVGFSDERPEPGYISAQIIDSILDTGATKRQLERNYQVIVWRLKENYFVHTNFSTYELSKKAAEIAEKFIGMPYTKAAMWNLVSSWYFGDEEDEAYAQSICERFNLNFDDKTCTPNTDTGNMACIEIIITAYQIAYMLLAGKQAKPAPLPDFLNINARIVPAELVKHFEMFPGAFEQVKPEHVHELIWSGSKHEGDPDTPKMQSKTFPEAFADRAKLNVS